MMTPKHRPGGDTGGRRLRTWAALVALLIPVLGTFAQRGRAGSGCWVMTKSGRRVPGVALQALPDGTLRLQLQRGGPIQTFKPGTYRAAYVPKPRQVTQLELLLKQKRYDDVVKYAPAVFNAFKFLGWGDYVAALHAQALLAQNKPKDALEVLDKGRPWVVLHEADLLRVRIRVLIALKQYDDALKMARTLAASDREDMAAFAFNVRGRILADQGKKREAVLEYLKTVLLFPPGKLKEERTEAKQQVVALLKELKDPRWKDFEKMR